MIVATSIGHDRSARRLIGAECITRTGPDAARRNQRGSLTLKRSQQIAMNLSWSNPTNLQPNALSALCQSGPFELPNELGEQLSNLGLAEKLCRGGYCVSPFGLTVAPSTLN